jgi:hypothetical protein
VRIIGEEVEEEEEEEEEQEDLLDVSTAAATTATGEPGMKLIFTTAVAPSEICRISATTRRPAAWGRFARRTSSRSTNRDGNCSMWVSSCGGVSNK